MNQINLSQFIIGSQYEDYEFHLDFKEINIKNNIEYITYKYKQYEKHFFLNTEIKGGVFLVFNADILCEIVLIFNNIN